MNWVKSLAFKFWGLTPFEDLFNRWGLRFWSGSPQFNNYGDDARKLQVIFSNPALLKVFSLQCDLFSLGRIKVFEGDNEIPDDPAIDRLNNPNPLQSRKQFLWDYMFWNMIGTAYGFVESKIVEKERNMLYFLDTTKLDFPQALEKIKDKLIFSQKAENELGEIEVTYRYNDGTTIKIKMKDLLIITDLTNGTGNWFKSFSRIDALYKIISNSEENLNAKNINTRYTGKFIVSGKQDPSNPTQLPMGETEKTSVEEQINGEKQVHAMKSMIDIKRFVENLANLKLGAAYLEDYFLIGSMYNIPRDVLEAYNSATYENQEKARGSHVSYCLEPKGEDLMAALAKRWGYTKKRLVISWSHLPFMQVFEKDRAQVKNMTAQTFVALTKSGVPAEEANKYLDLNFTQKPPANANQTQN